MEAIVTITLIALVIILGTTCFWQHLIINVNRKDVDTMQKKVWKLQEKYSIPDEEIRACFYPDHQ